MNWKARITNENFTDSVRNLNFIIVGHLIMVLLLLLYLSICAAELLGVGLPGYAVDYGPAHFELSKGFLFDIFIWSLPSIYACLRLGMAYAIVDVMWRRHQVQLLEA